MKYKNIKTDGYSSKREDKRAKELKILEKSGAIAELREQVVYILAPSVVVQGRKRPDIKYIADFVYVEKDSGPSVWWPTIVEDCKGFKTPVYNLKRHLMKSVHNIDILET